MKKILLLGDDRTGLMSPIIEEMTSQGYYVDYIDASELDKQRKYPSILHRLMAKLVLNFFCKGKKNWGREKYVREISSESYSHVLVFIPAMINSFIARDLRKKTENLVCILWDSLNKVPCGDVLNTYADKIFSFDYDDCKNINVNYLPSYHQNQIDFNVREEQDIFGVFSIGTDRDPRYQEILAFVHANENITGEIILVSDKLNESLVTINNINVLITNHKVLGCELDEKIKKSKGILDIVDPRQVGLSFRLGHAFQYKKLLITNNESIKNETWFEGDYIYFQAPNYRLNENKFSESFCEVESPYIIEAWVKTLLSFK